MTGGLGGELNEDKGVWGTVGNEEEWCIVVGAIEWVTAVKGVEEVQLSNCECEGEVDLAKGKKVSLNKTSLDMYRWWVLIF